MAMVGDVDLDFSRYVAIRHGMAEKLAREGAAYAFGGERRFLRTISAARPVTLAIEATVRLWNGAAKRELLEKAIKATGQSYPIVHETATRCALVLRIPTPSVYVTPPGT